MWTMFFFKVLNENFYHVTCGWSKCNVETLERNTTNQTAFYFDRLINPHLYCATQQIHHVKSTHKRPLPKFDRAKEMTKFGKYFSIKLYIFRMELHLSFGTNESTQLELINKFIPKMGIVYSAFQFIPGKSDSRTAT